jgi:dTDP-glucose 4,6-dehydratase
MSPHSLFPWERWFEFLAPKIDNKTLAISGSTGFVGKALISFLGELTLATGINLKLITGSNTNSLALQDNGQILHEHASGGSAALLKLFERNPVSHFIHLATPTTKESGSSDPAQVSASTLDILEGIVDLPSLGSKLRLVHASSGAVYGPRIGKEIPSQLRDEWDLTPFNDAVKDHYTSVKRQAESTVKEGTESGKWLGTNARLFAFMGPGLPLNSHFAIGNFVADSIAKRDITIRGNPLTVRAYLPSEVMAANLLESTFGVFYPDCHVSSDSQHTLETFAELVAAAGGTQVSRELNSTPASYYVGAQDKRLKTSIDVDLVAYLEYWISLQKLG